MIGGTRVIIIGGMKRSGSTWQFNLTRTILEMSGRSYDAVSGLRALRAYDGEASHLVVKTHWWSEMAGEVADVVLTSVRDESDARASLSRFGREEVDDETMQKVIDHFRAWNSVSDYCMEYEDLVERPGHVVSKCLAVLGAEELDPDVVLEAVESIVPPSEGGGKDPVTFYFSNHITSG